MTIHRIDAGVDTGDILAQLRPALKPGDVEADVLVRMARMAGRLLPELLAVGDDVTRYGCPLGPGGEAYRYGEWTAAHDRWLRAQASLVDYSSREHVTKYYPCSDMCLTA